MSTITQPMLSIFEPVIRDLKELIECDFCHEQMPRALFDTNHGLIFNGWCIKAMMFHNRVHSNHPEEIAWLQKHGIDPRKSRFDESHWHMQNRAKYEARNV